MELVYSALASLVVGILGFVLQSSMKENRKLRQQYKNEYANEQSAIRKGLQCILRDTLISNHSKYVELGHISRHGLQNWLLMYDAYHSLGGNGLIDNMKQEIEELPIK